MLMFSIKHVRKPPHQDYVKVASRRPEVIDNIELVLAKQHDCPVEEVRRIYAKRINKTQIAIHDIFDLDDFLLVLKNITDAIEAVPVKSRKTP